MENSALDKLIPLNLLQKIIKQCLTNLLGNNKLAYQNSEAANTSNKMKCEK